MRAVKLSSEDDFEGWRDIARALTAERIPPSQIIWQVGDVATDLFAASPQPEEQSAQAASEVRVPRAFVDLARTVILHRDAERFALLYGLLIRVVSQPRLISDHADPLVRRLEEMAKAVRREIHKMRAFLRFREVEEQEGPGRFVAWFEPEHHIVRRNARFFVDRFANMHWSILTPEISMHWDGETLREGPGAVRSDAPDGDRVEEAWKSYYAAIFNPARLKTKAMLKEMPRKYWKNMPETALIGSLIAGARERELAMVEKARAVQGEVTPLAWERLREEAMGCTRCPLHRPATQTVFGEGPVDASMMFLGEQPGDQEDLAGRAFVGPAGAIFNKALAEARIARDKVYVTNAVKHLKFEQRGKQRIHVRPAAGEISACRWWYSQERLLVRPAVTVALGATAARQMLGRAASVGEVRGQAIPLEDGSVGWVTIHPSYLLRLPDAMQAEAEYRRFVDELSGAARLLSTL